MRIPESHKEVLDLIEELKVPTIEFIFSSDDSYYYINGAKTEDGKIMTKKYALAHPNELGFIKIQIISEHVPHSRARDPVDFDGITLHLNRDAKPDLWQSVVSIYNRIYDDLAADMEALGTDKFFDTYAQYRVYSYFHYIIPTLLKRDTSSYPPPAKVEGLVDSVLHFAEMTESATGLNNLALVESVIDSRNFASGQKWHTVKDGMHHFPDALASKLDQGKIIREAQVTAIEPADGGSVKITWEHKAVTNSEVFDTVLVTAPFGSVRFMNISVPFTYGKKQAIRSLNYDHSTKIFAQFPKRWWELEENKVVGGASLTDLPVRTVVYPSYGLNDSGKGVLLCSYTWQNEAIMWANVDERTKKEVVIRNLSLLHGTKPFAPEEVELATHTWLEAFSLFGPGQFKLMINAMVPERGCHFAGEHLSTYHAWILGALYSATRAVREILVLEGLASIEESWEKIPDGEFDADSWKTYMGNVKSSQ